MERIRLELEPSEYRSLVRLSERELRPVPDQARFLIREALSKAGVLEQVSRSEREASEARVGA